MAAPKVKRKKPARREQVAELRKLGLTQKEVGERLGITENAVAQYERRTRFSKNSLPPN